MPYGIRCRSRSCPALHSPCQTFTAQNVTFLIQYEPPWHRYTDVSGQTMLLRLVLWNPVRPMIPAVIELRTTYTLRQTCGDLDMLPVTRVLWTTYMPLLRSRRIALFVHTNADSSRPDRSDLVDLLSPLSQAGHATFAILQLGLELRYRCYLVHCWAPWVRYLAERAISKFVGDANGRSACRACRCYPMEAVLSGHWQWSRSGSLLRL